MVEQKKATFPVDIRRLAHFISTYVVCKLGLTGLDSDETPETVYAVSFDGAYQLANRVIDCQKLEGKIPLELWAVLNCIRTGRVVTLEGYGNIACSILAVDTSKASDPPVRNSIVNYRSLLAYLAQISPDIDLEALGVDTLTFPVLGNLDFSKTLGPLSLGSFDNVRAEFYCSFFDISDAGKLNWLKFITLLSSPPRDLTFQASDRIITTPVLIDATTRIYPAVHVLMNMCNRSFWQLKTIALPVYNPEFFNEMVAKNLLRRGVKASTGKLLYNSYLYVGELLSRIAVRAGQVAFVKPALRQSQIVFPTDISESVCVYSFLNSGVLHIPIVSPLFEIKENVTKYYKMDTSTVAKTTTFFGMASSNCYDAVSGHWLTEALQGNSYNIKTSYTVKWGEHVTYLPEEKADTVAFDMFKDTNGRGDLSISGGERYLGEFNMARFQYEGTLKDSKFTPRAVICHDSTVRAGSQLNFFTHFVLGIAQAPQQVDTSIESAFVPQKRLRAVLENPIESALVETVVEDKAATRTVFQRTLEKVQADYHGDGSLFQNIEQRAKRNRAEERKGTINRVGHVKVEGDQARYVPKAGRRRGKKPKRNTKAKTATDSGAIRLVGSMQQVHAVTNKKVKQKQ